MYRQKFIHAIKKLPAGQNALPGKFFDAGEIPYRRIPAFFNVL